MLQCIKVHQNKQKISSITNMPHLRFFSFFFGMSLIHNIYQLYKIARFSSFFLKRDLDLSNYRRDVAFNLNYNSMHVSRQFDILQINIDKLSLKHQTMLHGTKNSIFYPKSLY